MPKITIERETLESHARLGGAKHQGRNSRGC